MSLGLVVLEKKLFTRTRTRTPTPQSDDIKNNMSLSLLVLEKLFMRMWMQQSDDKNLLNSNPFIHITSSKNRGLQGLTHSCLKTLENLTPNCFWRKQSIFLSIWQWKRSKNSEYLTVTAVKMPLQHNVKKMLIYFSTYHFLWWSTWNFPLAFFWKRVQIISFT